MKRIAMLRLSTPSIGCHTLMFVLTPSSAIRSTTIVGAGFGRYPELSVSGYCSGCRGRKKYLATFCAKKLMNFSGPSNLRMLLIVPVGPKLSISSTKLRHEMCKIPLPTNEPSRRVIVVYNVVVAFHVWDTENAISESIVLYPFSRYISPFVLSRVSLYTRFVPSDT
jgi:hypothetical protein